MAEGMCERCDRRRAAFVVLDRTLTGFADFDPSVRTYRLVCDICMELEFFGLGCGPCGGSGWINRGYIAPPPPLREGEAFPDVLLVDWRRCRRCAGTGVYISRARAGLATRGYGPAG